MILLTKKRQFCIGIGLLYILFTYFYIFVIAKDPSSGMVKDLAAFLTVQERALIMEYRKIGNFLFLLELPLEVAFYFVLIKFGIAKNGMHQVEKRITNRSGQLALFTLMLSAASFLIFLPFRIIRFWLARTYAISVQSVPSWIQDRLIDFSLQTLLLFFVVILLAALLKRRHWWLYAWCLSVPVVIGIVFVQPVLIDPLYHTFSSLKDAELEKKVLELAAASGIPEGRVYEVQMAEKMNTYNAYVNSIGANARIVLWDTTLERLDEEEILFITAHEIGHYVEKHVYLGMTGYIFGGLILLYLIERILQVALRRQWISSYQHPATIVFILFLFATLTLVARPLELAASRHLEWRADRFAVELTENPEAGIRAFRKMTRASLSELKPPVLIK